MRSLRFKITAVSVVLVIFSLVIAVAVFYIASYRIILRKANQVNQILTDAAAQTIGTYLDKIADVAIASVNNGSIEGIIEPGHGTTYPDAERKDRYNYYLRQIIKYHDEIDAIVFVNEHDVVLASNVRGDFYRTFYEPSFFSGLKNTLASDARGPFFLGKYAEGQDERTVVYYPIYGTDRKEVRACIIIVPGEAFFRNINFPGGCIYLVDKAGTSVPVTQTPDAQSFPEGNLRYESNPGFDGWKIIGVSNSHEIHSKLGKNIPVCIGIGIPCILFAVLVVLYVSRRLVEPIQEMNRQVRKLTAVWPDNISIRTKNRKMRFRTTLLTVYSLFVTVPVISVALSFYINTKQIIENEVDLLSQYSTDLLLSQVNFIFDDYFESMVELSENERIQELLKYHNLAETDRQKAGESGEIMLKQQVSETVLSKQAKDPSLLNVALYDKDFDIIYSSVYGGYLMDAGHTKDHLQHLKGNKDRYLWSHMDQAYGGETVFRTGMPIRTGTLSDYSERGGEIEGYLVLDWNDQGISSVFDNFSCSSDIGVYLYDQNGEMIIKSSHDRTEGDIALSEEEKLKIASGQSLQYGNRSKEGYTATGRKIHANDWMLVAFVPLKEYHEGRVGLLLHSLILIGGLVAFSMVFSYRFSVKLGKNIKALLEVVRKVRKGDLDVRFKGNTGDEIEELGNSFNVMLDRLKEMIYQKIMSEMKAKDAEIRAKEFQLNLLQLQINPHFLYNTLKTVQYMVLCNDPRAEKMIKLLINLFRTSIGSGEKLVHVEEEIKHVQTYIEIQQIRFSNKFRITYDIPDEIMNLLILKLTLQPIVENAVFHGLELMEEGGEIHIDAAICRDKLRIRIFDNGRGIRQEELSEIREQLQGKARSRSIGLKNVHERIQLYFGKEYGVEIESTEGKGTTVSLWFPVNRDDEDVE